VGKSIIARRAQAAQDPIRYSPVENLKISASTLQSTAMPTTFKKTKPIISGTSKTKG